MEGVTQAEPLAMAFYGIALLPLIKYLRRDCPRVLQPWYADDSAMRGTGHGVAACFHKLCMLCRPAVRLLPRAGEILGDLRLGGLAGAKTDLLHRQVPGEVILRQAVRRRLHQLQGHGAQVCREDGGVGERRGSVGADRQAVP